MGAPYRGAAGILAIGLPATVITNYATSIPATHILHVEGFGEGQSATSYDRRTLASGAEDGLGISALQYAKSVSFSGPICDLSFPILWALALGKDTIGTALGTTCYPHACTPIGLSEELPQVSLHFKQTAIADTTSVGSIRYDGCILDSLSVTGAAGGIWRYTATFLTSGLGGAITTDLSGITKKPNFLPFRFGGTQCQYGNGTPTALTSDGGIQSTAQTVTGFGTMIDVATILREQTFSVNNNCANVYTAGDTTGAATVTVRGTRTTSVTSRFIMDNTGSGSLWPRSWVTYASFMSTDLAHSITTRCVSNSAAGTSFNYGFQIQVPRATCTSVDVDKTLGQREVSTTHVVVNPNNALGATSIAARGWNVDSQQYTP